MAKRRMDNDSVLRELKDLAEKLGVKVQERVLKKRPIRVMSGLCKVRGKPVLIIDRKIAVQDKIDLLVETLRPLEYDEVYILPFIRELIAGFKAEAGKKEKPGLEEEVSGAVEPGQAREGSLKDPAPEPSEPPQVA